MHRNNRRNEEQRRNTQLQAWDPFAEMMDMRNRMFADFGRGFFDDFPRGNGFGFGPGFSRNFDSPFADFDGMLDQVRERGNGRGGNYVMQSYSTKVVTGPDGRPIVEKTINNEQTTIGRDGKRITEKQHVYKNSAQNIKRVTKERALDDKGVRVTREIRNDQRNEYRHLNNLEEEEVDDFNNNFNMHVQQNNLPRLGVTFGSNDRRRSEKPRTQVIRMIRND